MTAIVLVEPDHDFRAIYATALLHAGYTVIEAATTDEGLVRAAEAAPALAILSLKANDAWRFLQGRPQGLPVLALTWEDTPAERERVLQYGHAHYAARPIDVRRLLALVREAGGGLRAESSPLPGCE